MDRVAELLEEISELEAAVKTFKRIRFWTILGMIVSFSLEIGGWFAGAISGMMHINIGNLVMVNSVTWFLVFIGCVAFLSFAYDFAYDSEGKSPTDKLAEARKRYHAHLSSKIS